MRFAAGVAGCSGAGVGGLVIAGVTSRLAGRVADSLTALSSVPLASSDSSTGSAGVTGETGNPRGDSGGREVASAGGAVGAGGGAIDGDVLAASRFRVAFSARGLGGGGPTNVVPGSGVGVGGPMKGGAALTSARPLVLEGFTALVAGAGSLPGDASASGGPEGAGGSGAGAGSAGNALSGCGSVGADGGEGADSTTGVFAGGGGAGRTSVIEIGRRPGWPERGRSSLNPRIRYA